MKIWSLYAILLVCLGCALRPMPEVHKPLSSQAVVEAWSEGFNGKNIDILRGLIHPLKKATFLSEEPRIKHTLRRWRFLSYKFGQNINVNGGLLGREIQLNYHDGNQTISRKEILVSSEGRWWVWSF